MRIRMEAPPERIFALAADVERWPLLLPHYRYVRRLRVRDGERHFAMGARRGRIPVRWRATQRPRPDDGIIEFTHTGGVTRGMRVAWRLVPDGGATEVSIEHRLELGWPVIGRFAAERVIGPLFVDAIAGRTLRRIKQLVETDR
ncbi:MAG TPA: SRPBCC family protein [Candidatus Limnocylindria bacterium]|nr:SRPBCC family protein [Candidatus Limnocylindria bacterium]